MCDSLVYSQRKYVHGQAPKHVQLSFPPFLKRTLTSLFQKAFHYDILCRTLATLFQKAFGLDKSSMFRETRCYQGSCYHTQAERCSISIFCSRQNSYCNPRGALFWQQCSAS
ncbi:hypothetical protein SORBI_3001G498033 [Sorghum bicolor]|uniref:Uncharacterized protein n=1 Tax=Sorghum bicolor TaxID=4558 RepID=A0A1Z5SBC9_SORBI|nr:hypothetical protein SORBI_3001G498033 [Sorghum bicolor]